VVVTRSEVRADEFNRQGYQSMVADVTRPETLQRVPAADVVLFAVGYDRSAGKPIHDTYADGMRNVLAALPPGTGRSIYISTTGVYGQAHGQWVDEDTPPDPQREGGIASFAAESILAGHSLGRRSMILRLAGLYGPGRLPYIEDLRAGKPIAAPSAGYLNLIHVDDAAAAIVAAGRIAPFDDGPRVYCVSDGHPVERGEFYREVARQIGSPPPTFVDPVPNTPRALRASADRRVRNDRMLRAFDFQLAYPDYRAGIAAILEAPAGKTGEHRPPGNSPV
jgi:nucleoside-diphosphate-sugar epimerase